MNTACDLFLIFSLGLNISLIYKAYCDERSLNKFFIITAELFDMIDRAIKKSDKDPEVK